MLKREQKKETIEQLKNDIARAKGVFLTNLIGIPANNAVELRKKVRLAQGKVVVTRNSLFERAGEGSAMGKLLSDLEGPHALAFAFEDVIEVAKCLKEASKEYPEVILFKGGTLGTRELSAKEAKALADLPSRPQILATLLATMMAPLGAFVRTLNAIKEKKETVNNTTSKEN